MSGIIERLCPRRRTIEPSVGPLRIEQAISAATLIDKNSSFSPQKFAEFVTGMINMLGAHQTRGHLNSRPLTDITNQRYITFHQEATGSNVIAFCKFPTTTATGLASVTEYWHDPKVGEGFIKITGYWRNRKRQQGRVLQGMTLRVASPNEVGLWCQETLRTFQKL